MSKKIYLPESIYESLPWIYLGFAAMLAVLVSSAFKWPIVVCLAIAALAIRRRRRNYREAQYWERAATFIDKVETHRKKNKRANEPSTVEI